MNIQDIQEYLVKYDKTAIVINYEDLPSSERRKLPTYWNAALAKTGRHRDIVVLNQWRTYRDTLRAVVRSLEKHLKSVHLIKSMHGYSLIYCIKSPNSDRYLIYVGGNPQGASLPESVKSVWKNVPYRLKHFYENIHNGWFYFSSRSMGLSPMEDFFLLSEEEWEGVDSINAAVNLNQALAIYTNGMGSFVCIEIRNGKPYTLLWHKDQNPDKQWKLWPLLDNWTAIGFES